MKCNEWKKVEGQVVLCTLERGHSGDHSGYFHEVGSGATYEVTWNGNEVVVWDEERLYGEYRYYPHFNIKSNGRNVPSVEEIREGD